MSLRELTSRDAVLKAMREYNNIGRTAFLTKYGFRKSREYMLEDSGTGKRYDSKAIVGAAYGFQFPGRGPLTADDFVGGEATVEPKLRQLGFNVVRIGQDWTEAEVTATVKDYFNMLASEAKRKSYNKARHNQQLRSGLNGRSAASVELKHQNISAILAEMDLPYIPGYKPRSNAQELLRQAVRKYVERHVSIISAIVDGFEEIGFTPPEPGENALVDAPVPYGATAAKLKRPRLPRKLDYAARDEQNRDLGVKGEEWALVYERNRLAKEGHSNFAKRIEWVSKVRGDGLGYDIMSFDTEGAPLYIEVKTTVGGALTPFIVSKNEVEFSAEVGDAFRLYRVFHFASSPKLYILKGALENSTTLDTQTFRARPK